MSRPGPNNPANWRTAEGYEQWLKQQLRFRQLLRASDRASEARDIEKYNDLRWQMWACQDTAHALWNAEGKGAKLPMCPPPHRVVPGDNGQWVEVPMRTTTRDETGREIESEKLRRVFEARTLFWRIRKDLNDAIKSLSEVAESPDPRLRIGMDYLQMRQASIHLQNALRTIKHGMPHAVCPVCQGVDDIPCRLCGGKGYVNKALHTQYERSINDTGTDAAADDAAV